ncbi:MAG: hypothetical protein WAK90_09630 [Pseudolabrys sp.]|jgi:hypothetical protein
MSRAIKVRAARCRKKIGTLAQQRRATDVYADPAKTAAKTRQGLAEWIALGNGIFELTLFSGEIFHLDETSVTRIG